MEYLAEGSYLSPRLTRSLDTYLLIRSAVLRSLGYLHLRVLWDQQGTVTMDSVTEVGC
jgi:hypothetical protein